MSEPVTQLQFYEEMQKLRADFQTMHTRMRDSMTEGFSRMAEKLDQHKDEDDRVEQRVLIIETERKEEAKQAMKHGTWAGILAAIGANAIIEAAKGSWWR